MNRMIRCDYCEYKNSWDCEDWKVDNDVLCENFKLCFDSLNDRQKEKVQRILMKAGEQGG